MKRKLTIFIVLICAALLIAAILNIVTQQLRFVVIRSNLQNAAKFSIYGPVVFEFNKPVTDALFRTCQLTTQPTATFSGQFQDTTLTFTPLDMYQPETEYAARLQCSGVDSAGKFTTLPIDQSTESDLQKAQTESDFETGQAFQEVFDKQPWRAKLPLKGQYYTLIYDQVDNVYYLTFAIPAGSSVTKDEVVSQAKIDLQKIGAPDLQINYVN